MRITSLLNMILVVIGSCAAISRGESKSAAAAMDNALDSASAARLIWGFAVRMSRAGILPRSDRIVTAEETERADQRGVDRPKRSRLSIRALFRAKDIRRVPSLVVRVDHPSDHHLFPGLISPPHL